MTDQEPAQPEQQQLEHGSLAMAFAVYEQHASQVVNQLNAGINRALDQNHFEFAGQLVNQQWFAISALFEARRNYIAHISDDEEPTEMPTVKMPSGESVTEGDVDAAAITLAERIANAMDQGTSNLEQEDEDEDDDGFDEIGGPA